MTKIQLSNKLLWVSWIIVTSIGMALGLSIGFALVRVFGDNFAYQSETLFLLFLITLGGLFIGLGQCFILRTKLRNVWLWVPATTIGLPLGFFTSFWTNEFLLNFISIDDWAYSFLLSSFTGMFLGLLQGVSLHRNSTYLFRWVIITGLSWGLSMVIIGDIFVSYLQSIEFIPYGFLYWMIVGLFIGMVVGVINGAYVEITLFNYKFEKNGSTFFNASHRLTAVSRVEQEIE
jgi:hypothetical protein